MAVLESADRLPFRVLYDLRRQNCTEKLIAAPVYTPVYESAFLVGIVSRSAVLP